jgi:hypothetical protein
MAFEYTIDGEMYRIRDLVIAPHPKERILADLYFRFESQGLMEVFFYEAEKPTLLWWLNTFLAKDTSTLACYRETPEGEYGVDGKRFTPIGMMWINKSWPIGNKFKKAECGMGFVRRVPIPDTVACAMMGIDWSFYNLKLDTLIGTTPQPNRAATLFGQRIGFQQTTALEGYSSWHGKLCSVILQSMTKERWTRIKGQEEAAA